MPGESAGSAAQAKKSHPKVARFCDKGSRCEKAQALGASSCCSSPDSYISIMMSEPPMNSPCT